MLWKAVAVNLPKMQLRWLELVLATVSDATTGGVKTYTVNVEEGKLVLDDATGNVGALLDLHKVLQPVKMA